MMQTLFQNPSEWRHEMAVKITEMIDMERFGVEAVYLIGSTKAYTAGPGSDIDLLVHFSGDENQKNKLMTWLDGWGHALGVVNEKVTGIRSGNLLDIHLITDSDIEKETSFAVMIRSHHNRASLLRKR